MKHKYVILVITAGSAELATLTTCIISIIHPVCFVSQCQCDCRSRVCSIRIGCHQSYNRRKSFFWCDRSVCHTPTSFRGINTDNARGGMKRSDMFLGGLETGVRRISLPRELTLFPGDVEEDQVHYFEEDTRLAFYPDGTFGRQALESPQPETIITIGERSAYLIARPKVALHVRGVVNGAVLVYSPSNIIVEDNLVYANDPEVDPESDDYLGLVSDRYVKIAGAETTGEGDLVIHASIYAKRRFSVGRFRSRNDGTLDIFGSLSAGSISATEPRYRTRIRFDPRLADLRAPSFPMTDRYEVAAWDNLWVKR